MNIFAATVAALAIFETPSCVNGFSPKLMSSESKVTSSVVELKMGYLDDLSPISNPNIEEKENDSHEATKMKAEDIDRAGPGSWESYVEFNEFDGGDGQMGVAGDGNAKLDKFDMSEMAKSKTMSAKNAWGRSTGYAEVLREKGVDTARAQQLENWHNQQEVLQRRKQQRFMTDEFDQTSTEDDSWRNLAAFGIERNQNFDFDATFGAVSAATEIEGTIELTGRMNGPYATHEFALRNPFMGFADFRAAFTDDSSSDFTVEPTEGALRQKEDTNFLIKFKAQKPGIVEGYLVIETEDFKKTWKVVGNTN